MYFSLSKELVYNFHYYVIKSKYGDNIDVCYQEADSNIYDIVTEAFYKDMNEKIDHFDTSDYPKDNIYDIPEFNERIIRKMKDNYNGKIMEEFVG